MSVRGHGQFVAAWMRHCAAVGTVNSGYLIRSHFVFVSARFVFAGRVGKALAELSFVPVSMSIDAAACLSSWLE